MTTFGYYCLHPDQDPNQQRQTLTDAGCTVIRHDTWTTHPGGQPALDQILDQAVAGDGLTAYAFIDLARSLDHLQQLVRTLHERDVVLRCLREDIDTAGPHGQLVRAALNTVIDLRREERSEATLEGLDQARARGARLGRPTTAPPWLDDARSLRAGRRPVTEIADLLGIHRSMAYRL
jgi:DNA invertase Pin-like site-specific DNA recombinase